MLLALNANEAVETAAQNSETAIVVFAAEESIFARDLGRFGDFGGGFGP